jgi:hypothetical protein
MLTTSRRPPTESETYWSFSMPHPLLLVVFIHKDLADHDADDIYDKQFRWLTKEFEIISGRPLAIIFKSPSDAPALTHLSYKIDSPDQTLYSWYQKIDQYKDDYTIDSYNDHTRKFLLLTRDNLSSTVAGIASQKGYCAISSINGDQTPAHEVGHMFGARHEDFEVYYNGWWDETIMTPSTIASTLRGNAKRFSDKNRENIRNYLEEHD